MLSPSLSGSCSPARRESLGQVRAAADRALRGFALPDRLSIARQSDWQDFHEPEVIGLLPGADPSCAANMSC